MKTKVDIGIIGAMDSEVNSLISELKRRKTETIGSVTFHIGILEGKRVAIARCGIGKVFAAICTEAMIIAYSPDIIINTGVGGGLAPGIKALDVVVADKLVQHDMDTSPLGDPRGLVSEINVVYFEADKNAVALALDAARENSVVCHSGTVASGDVFVADGSKKKEIRDTFGADVCEMEGAAIAHTAFVNGTRFVVIRAISDSADADSSLDYAEFLPIAAENSAKITKALCRKL